MIFLKISHINFVQLELVSSDQYQSLARKDLKHIQAMVNLFFFSFYHDNLPYIAPLFLFSAHGFSCGHKNWSGSFI